MKSIDKLDGNVIPICRRRKAKVKKPISTPAQIREAKRLIADYDRAVTEHGDAKAKLMCATFELEIYARNVSTPAIALAALAGRGPVDAYGDPLYKICRKCGGLQTRWIRTRSGERLAMESAASPCNCVKPARPRKP
jgi:hypothetical protein